MHNDVLFAYCKLRGAEKKNQRNIWFNTYTRTHSHSGLDWVVNNRMLNAWYSKRSNAIPTITKRNQRVECGKEYCRGKVIHAWISYISFSLSCFSLNFERTFHCRSQLYTGVCMAMCVCLLNGENHCIRVFDINNKSQ